MSTQTSPTNSVGGSPASLQKPRLKLINITGAKIPLIISEELQNQITYLCQQVNKVEWSGTIFYTTEGTFGSPDFKAFGHSLYLLDIGTESYTEYEPSDPSFIKFMMDNLDKGIPEMNRGHIHSHHNMAVFFSGVDNDELVDNSPLYNFYLSLIVGNNNNMVARVAFLANTITEEKTILNFKGIEGVETIRETSKKAEGSAIFAYDCEVIVPERVNDPFRERLEQIKSVKEAQRLEALKNTKPITTGGTGNPYNGFNTAQRYKEGWKKYDDGDLFDDVKDAEIPPVARTTPGVNGRVYDLLVKLVNIDANAQGTLSKSLKLVNDKLYNEESPAAFEALTYYYEQVEGNAVNFYIDTFPEDFNLKGFDKAMEDCIDMLESYEGEFPELIDPLIAALNLSIEDDVVEEEEVEEELTIKEMIEKKGKVKNKNRNKNKQKNGGKRN